MYRLTLVITENTEYSLNIEFSDKDSMLAWARNAYPCMTGVRYNKIGGRK